MKHRGKNRKHVNSNAILDAVFVNQPKHIKRWCEKHGKSLKEGINHFRSLARKHKRAKREALKHKHIKAGTWRDGSKERREAKRKEAYQAKKKALREQRIMFAKAGARFSSVDKDGKKIPLAVIVNTNAPQASTETVRSVSMNGASSLPLAA